MNSRHPTDAPYMPALNVTAENLTRLDADAAGALEARRAHLRELAYSLLIDRPNPDILLERMGTFFSANMRQTPEGLAENAAFLAAGFTRLSTLERAELCRLVCAAGVPFAFPTFFGNDDPLPRSAQGLIAYLQNTFTDRAYHAFSRTMPRARSQYHDSYGAACEAVSAGSCEACILPIEHAQDGKLLGFYRLIDRYELKIVCTCDLAQQDGTESRFALLKKNFTFPLPADALSYLFELSVTRSAGDSVGLILDAARLCGLSLRRIDSIPLAYTEDSFAYHAVYTWPDVDALFPFLLYLALEMPQYNPIGLYAHISE